MTVKMTEPEITDSGSDRRGFMKGAAATAAAAGAGALASGTANAAEGKVLGKSKIPFPPFGDISLGVDIPCSCYAANVPLTLDTGLVKVDFKGGIEICVKAFTNNIIELDIVGHNVVATLPDGTTVEIKQADAQITPLSFLQINTSGIFPYPEMILKLLFTLTITRPDGTQTVFKTDPSDPVQLSSGMLTSFPPNNSPLSMVGGGKMLDSSGNPSPVGLGGFDVLSSALPVA